MKVERQNIEIKKALMDKKKTTKKSAVTKTKSKTSSGCVSNSTGKPKTCKFKRERYNELSDTDDPVNPIRKLMTDTREVSSGKSLSRLTLVDKGKKDPKRIRPVGDRPPVSPGISVSKRQTTSPKTFFRKGFEDVPRFFWPKGKPLPLSTVTETIGKAEAYFLKLQKPIPYSLFSHLLKSIGFPVYWKKPFWLTLGLKSDDLLNSKHFIAFLHHFLSEFPDDCARFSLLISSTSKYYSDGTNNNIGGCGEQWSPQIPLKQIYSETDGSLEIGMSDFIPLVQDIVDTHPGLGFLRDAPEFHSRYVTTVVSRIFYKVNRSWSGRITLKELRRSNLLNVIKRLEEETDINNITEYFSYEHFYVIYCKFWEIDKDHDLLIDKCDLASHADHALSSRIIERIFSGTVIRGWDVNSTERCPEGKMTYSDFVWFLLSEEDKKSHTAIEYWFRCLDVDGDGILSPFELQYFYEEQQSRIESLGIEPLEFSNVFCQMVDMLHCSPTGIRLSDLKRNPTLASNCFNTLFNLDKYLEHEQRDPFAAAAAAAAAGVLDSAIGESDWDKYASYEYEQLIADESPSEHMHNSDIDDPITPS